MRLSELIVKIRTVSGGTVNIFVWCLIDVFLACFVVALINLLCCKQFRLLLSATLTQDIVCLRLASCL